MKTTCIHINMKKNTTKRPLPCLGSANFQNYSRNWVTSPLHTLMPKSGIKPEKSKITHTQKRRGGIQIISWPTFDTSYIMIFSLWWFYYYLFIYFCKNKWNGDVYLCSCVCVCICVFTYMCVGVCVFRWFLFGTVCLKMLSYLCVRITGIVRF